MKAEPSLLIRVDAAPEIGMGHVMRTLALAHAWLDAGGQVAFAMAAGAALVNSRLVRAGASLVEISKDRAALVAVAQATRADWVVLDGYEFDEEWQRAVVDADLRCCVIDDHARLRRYFADTVVDANVDADSSSYNMESANGRVLAGLGYALLRREFVSAARRKKDATKARRLLITFGGADSAGLTGRTLQSIKHAEYDVCVLVGAANLHLDALANAVRELPSARLISDATNVPELMDWADFAISAGGTTCTELAFMGLPTLALVVAENQTQGAKAFESRGTLRVIGNAETSSDAIGSALADLSADLSTRLSMAENGRLAVPSGGAARVVSVLRGDLS